MDNNLSSGVTWREENQSPTDLNPSDENKNIFLPLISELKNGQSTSQNKKETDKQKAEAISNASQIIDRTDTNKEISELRTKLQEELKNKDEKIDALRRKNDELKKTKPGIITEIAWNSLIVGGDYSSDGNWKTQCAAYSEICAKDEIIKKLKEDLEDKVKVNNRNINKIEEMSIANNTIKNALIKKDIEINEKDKVINHNNDKIEKKKKENNALKKLLIEKDNEIREKDDEIMEKDDEIMKKDKVINHHNNNIKKMNRENIAIKKLLIEKDKKLKENDELIKELQEKNECYLISEYKYNELKKKEEEINNNYGGMEQYNVLVADGKRKDEIIDKKSVEIARFMVEEKELNLSIESLTNEINELKKNQTNTNNSI